METTTTFLDFSRNVRPNLDAFKFLTYGENGRSPYVVCPKWICTTVPGLPGRRCGLFGRVPLGWCCTTGGPGPPPGISRTSPTLQHHTKNKNRRKGSALSFSATGVHSQILLTAFASILSRTSLKLKMAELDLFHSGLPSIDLSHHLNQHSKTRHPSPLKDIIKFMGFEGMVSLAGGTIICNLQDMSSVAHGQA